MFKALINTGVNDTLSADLIKRVRITNILALVVAILVIPYYFLFRHIGADFLSILIPIIVVFQLNIILLNKLGYVNASRFISATQNAIIVFIYSTSLGPDTRYYLFYFPQLSAAFIYFETRERAFFLFHFLLTPLLIFLDLFLKLQPFPAVILTYETAVFSSNFLMVFAFLLFGIILFALDKESKNVEETFRKKNQLIAEGECRLREAQKRESLSILAGGVAHDFNNQLTGIIGNIGLMLDDKSINSQMRYSLLEIEKAAGQSAKLTKQMLAYSGKGHFKVQEFDLSKIVEEMIKRSTSSALNNSELNFNLNRNLPPVKCDISQIIQLVTDLIINASEAIEENGGVINISTEAYFCNEDIFNNSIITKIPPSGEYVILIIEDSGCGMDEETVRKIFDPFFSTKFTGRGLGLAAIQGIVEGHNGAINVTSEKGVGTKFTVYFPVSDNK